MLERTKGEITNEQSRERQATLGTMNNPERRRQHWAHKAQNEDKTKRLIQEIKKNSNKYSFKKIVGRKHKRKLEY